MSEVKRYTQVCLPSAEDGATGRGFVATIRAVMGGTLPRWLAASDVDLAGPSRAELSVASRTSKVVRSDEYLDALSQAEQIVWANLFFCADESTARSISAVEDYVRSLAKAEFLARVVDADTYCFYGPSVVLDGRIGGLVDTNTDVIRGGLSELDFPE